MKYGDDNPELIELYDERINYRRAIMNTHYNTIVFDGLPRVWKLNLSHDAITKRARLWPVLDHINARIRRLK